MSFACRGELGPVRDGGGVRFALLAPGAEEANLCVFDGDAERRIELEEYEGVWHGYVPGAGPGTRYGFRCDGPFDPAAGNWWNPSKLLLDPYARLVSGDLVLDDAIFGLRDGHQDHRDSAPYVPRSVVADLSYDWAGDRPPGVPWADTVIYELHVRGFTKLHPEVPEELRGTYAGLAHPAAIGHLTTMGVTAVELLPVQHFVSEPALLRKGLRNYWGYNPVAWSAPHAPYAATGDPVREFRDLVRALHAAGIEVILDVVYNHTAEGDERIGPTLSFRGIDNRAYYLPGTDWTGTGNTVGFRSPAVLRTVMDSLRYWVTEMHVDGFRFDLAATLARGPSFLDVVWQDPVVSRAKLIAEPWDLGPGGHMSGAFPPPWAEWNDHYRDAVREFWRGRAHGVAELASRLSGSSDVYGGLRRPYASVNLVTSHDGFSLRDLVTYERKHNEANQEGNRDGTDDNRSWNCGVEGESADPDVDTLRGRQVRNLLTTLLVSIGVPMLAAGDELGRTQRGNNNAYCQDDETSWIDWAGADRELAAFVAGLVRLRHEQPVFRRRSFLADYSVGWYGPDGPITDWHADLPTLGMFLDGTEVGGDSFLVVLHAGAEPIHFRLPPGRFRVVTGDPAEHEGSLTVPDHSAIVLLAI